MTKLSAVLSILRKQSNLVAGPGVSASYQTKKSVFLGFLLFHIIFSLFAVAPGHLVGDERLHHMMVDSIVKSGRLDVWNGYDEFPSPELSLLVGRPRDGKIMPWYPPLYSFVAAPFYKLLGFRGLFLLNAMAFIAVLWIVYRLTDHLFDDPEMALNTVLIFSMATYAWEYSQAAWPHMLSVLIVVSVVALGVHASQSVDMRRSKFLAVAAGLLAGFGTGVRIEVYFVVAPLVMWLMFLQPVRWRQSLVILICTVPGLALVSALNHFKFGTWSPFTYGDFRNSDSEFTTIWPLVGFGLITSALIWIACVTRSTRLTGTLWQRLVVIAFGASLICVLSPFGREQLLQLGDGALQLLVDLRAREFKPEETGMLRGPNGSVIYPMFVLSMKKSLLQSCPYLVLLVVPLWYMRSRTEIARLSILFLICAAYIIFYSYFEWHGGQSLNLRYFLPILPFTSMLVAFGIREISEAPGQYWRRASIGTAIVVIVTTVALGTVVPVSLRGQELLLLTTPLLIALALFVFLVANMSMRVGSGSWLRGGLCVCMVASLSWASAVGFGYDFLRTYIVRKQRVDFIEQVNRVIEPDSIVFALRYKWFFGLTGSERRRLAVPEWDEFRDFRHLVDFHLDAGRPVYLFLDPEMESELHSRNLLQSLKSTVVFESRYGDLVELGHL